MFYMQEGTFCGSEGGEECSDVYRDGTGWDPTPEMCEGAFEIAITLFCFYLMS